MLGLPVQTLDEVAVHALIRDAAPHAKGLTRHASLAHAFNAVVPLMQQAELDVYFETAKHIETHEQLMSKSWQGRHPTRAVSAFITVATTSTTAAATLTFRAVLCTLAHGCSPCRLCGSSGGGCRAEHQVPGDAGTTERAERRRAHGAQGAGFGCAAATTPT